MMNKLAADACFGTGTYKIVEGGVEHLSSLVASF
jgi:hypothetical protein